MTMGPAPMIRMVFRSLRLGISSSVKSFPPRVGRAPGNLVGRSCIDRPVVDSGKHGLLHRSPTSGARADMRAYPVVMRIHRTFGTLFAVALHHSRHPVHTTWRTGVGDDGAGQRVAIG